MWKNRTRNGAKSNLTNSMKYLKRINERLYGGDAREVFDNVIKPYWEEHYKDTDFNEWYKGEYPQHTNKINEDSSTLFYKEELRNMINTLLEKSSPNIDKLIEIFEINEDNENALDYMYRLYEDNIIEYGYHIFLIPDEYVDWRDIDELRSLVDEYYEEKYS